MPTKTLIIDVREPSEYAAGHVEDALNIPPEQFVDGTFVERLAEVAHDTPIIVYCRTGARSHTCSQFLRQAGYSDITNGINQQQVEARFLRS